MQLYTFVDGEERMIASEMWDPILFDFCILEDFFFVDDNHLQKIFADFEDYLTCI